MKHLDRKMNRRKSLGLVGALGSIPFLTYCNPNNATSLDAVPLSKKGDIAYDLNNPKDQLLILEKLKGDLSGKLTYSYSEGRVFGIRPDLPEDLNGFGKEVFRYTGCGMSIKRPLENGNVETKSRGWLLYQDPSNGEYVKTMKNPYTNEVVDVPPFRAGIRGAIMTPNGPDVDATFSMESTAINAPLNLVFQEIGDRMHVTRHAFTKWLEKKSGTWRTEMTLDTFDFATSYLYDRSIMHIPNDFHWTSQTSWLTLLKMVGTPGHMIWTSNGHILQDKDQLPKAFVAATEQRQPDVFATPLTWDENEK